MRRRAARPAGEFATVARLFAPLADNDVARRLTDDVAWLHLGAAGTLVLKTDAVVIGVHCLPDDPADSVAAKALGRALSDLAAKGAAPLGYLLTLMVGAGTDAAWLARFARGLRAAQRRFGIALYGGETVRTPGPTAVAIAAIGRVPRGQRPLRGAARAGDDIWVSGPIGDAALGLLAARGRLKGLRAPAKAALIRRYRSIEPRLDLGRRIARQARAAIDISDGLVADLGHVARESALRATIDWPAVPLSRAAAAALRRKPALRANVLTGGDDYEILFTADARRRRALARLGCVRIGVMTKGRGVVVHDARGRPIRIARAGWQHF